MNTCQECYEEGQTAYGRCKCQEKYSPPQNVSKEWAKLFLAQWSRLMYLWDDGKLFSEDSKYHLSDYRYKRQREYAEICTTWLIPNGFEEPHSVAEGK